MTSKQCTKCKVEKPLEEFRRETNGPLGRFRWCRICQRASDKARYARNKDSVKDADYRRNYGFGLDQYNEMVQAQNGRCKICGTSKPGGRGNRLHVDHDHTTNVIRGLLCTNCNIGIGKFKDSPEFLETAANYLRAYQEGSDNGCRHRRNTNEDRR